MILEGIVTTLDESDRLNVAPMGPIVPAGDETLVLRPFQSSQTFRNLQVRPYGVFHLVDDVLLLAQAALDRLPSEPATTPARKVAGRVLENCTRWLEFEVTSCDASQDRSQITARVIHKESRRDFIGFNRAKHAVLEATILATRLHLLPTETVRAELERWEPAVPKTAGPQEETAWRLVLDYIDNWYRTHP